MFNQILRRTFANNYKFNNNINYINNRFKEYEINRFKKLKNVSPNKIIVNGEINYKNAVYFAITTLKNNQTNVEKN